MKFNICDDLPLKKVLELENKAISVRRGNNKYYVQNILGGCLHKL